MKRCASCQETFISAEWQCPACGAAPRVIDGFQAFAPAMAYQNQGFAPEFFRYLSAAEPGNFWFESRNRIIIWGLRKFFGEARTFLEIGCGTGFVLSGIRREFPVIEACGSEIFIDGLPFAAQRLAGVRLFQMDARSIPFESEFDVIGAFDVIEHIDEDRLVLENMRRALRPGGGALITVPQHPFLWSAVDEKSFHKRRYTAPELTEKLRDAGFEILHLTSFVSLLLPLMLLSRARRMGGSKGPVSDDEVKINPTLNRFFSKVMSYEELVLKRGWRLKFGGSLFAVARRPS